MNLPSQTRYLLVTGAILCASAIQLFRGYKPIIVVTGAIAFMFFGNLTVYLSGAKERAVRKRQKRDYYAGVLLLSIVLGSVAAKAQLIGEPAIPAKIKKQKRQPTDLEWMWQYGPPPAEGREHELIQDPHYKPFLDRYFTAPQAFWGPAPTDPKAPTHKSLANTVDDFMTIPGRVYADDNRYITATGAVRRLRTSRGLLFADLNAPTGKDKEKEPLVVFAAIDWIRDSKTTDDPDAQYTLWIFANQSPGPANAPLSLPPALLRSLKRWMAEPIAGTGLVQKVTAAVLVAPDGTPHQIPVPAIPEAAKPASKPADDDGPVLNKRPS